MQIAPLINNNNFINNTTTLNSLINSDNVSLPKRRFSEDFRFPTGFGHLPEEPLWQGDGHGSSNGSWLGYGKRGDGGLGFGLGGFLVSVVEGRRYGLPINRQCLAARLLQSIIPASVCVDLIIPYTTSNPRNNPYHFNSVPFRFINPAT